MESLRIDCDECVMRNTGACDDCVVTVLLGSTRLATDVTFAGPLPVEVDEEERAALAVLAASGLVPPLRLVNPGNPSPADGEESTEHAV